MKKRSNISICMHLITLVRPLTGYMLLAVIMGLAGHLCAALIPVLGGMAFLKLSGYEMTVGSMMFSLKMIFTLALAFALLRGTLHYGEQACNHFIAFKLLALIRDRVFKALRRLCPAKLEGKDKGDLITVITSDIELLEVFYAHTISPTAIAILMSIVMTVWIGSFSVWLGVIAMAAYILVGAVLPLAISKWNKDSGRTLRAQSGELGSFVLESMRGLTEILQYDAGRKRLTEMDRKNKSLSALEACMKVRAGVSVAITNTVILCMDMVMLFTAGYLYLRGQIDFPALILSVIGLMSSFGPVVALANLGSGLQNTFAAGNRVLDLLEENPAAEDICGMQPVTFSGAGMSHVTFSYAGEAILSDVSLEIPEHSIVGIAGRSGSGKSTILKLLMRFWSVQEGEVNISGKSVNQVNTVNLREIESYMTQETHLFHDSIANNLRIAKRDAAQAEIEEACRKAAVHDFIMSLPNGYETAVGELGDTLSGGERQRLGLARAFLSGAPLMILDEPTSNLDSLNEAVILKSIHRERKDKTVVLVSHRESTMRLADFIYRAEHGRMS